MGLCYSYGLDMPTLKSQMQKLKWFAYWPSFEGVAGFSDQFFVTAIRQNDGSKKLNQTEIESLLNPACKDLILAVNFPKDHPNVVWITLKLNDPDAGVKLTHFDEMTQIENELNKLNVTPVQYVTGHDLLCGDLHPLKKDYKKYARDNINNGFRAPPQNEWYFGDSWETLKPVHRALMSRQPLPADYVAKYRPPVPKVSFLKKIKHSISEIFKGT
jgi:hypothetical protein